MARTRDRWRWLRTAEFLVLIIGFGIAATTYYDEIGDRQNQRLVESWQLLTAIAPGASGKVRALEYLHANGESLVAINLSVLRHGAPVYLRGLRLFDTQSGQGADLRLTSFAGAIMRDSDVRMSDFFHSCLYKTEFGHAKLAGSNLTDADLTDANLLEADLTGVSFKHANLSGTQMDSSKGLTQAQLNEAYICTGREPSLPEGLHPPEAVDCDADISSNAQGCLWSRVRTYWEE